MSRIAGSADSEGTHTAGGALRVARASFGRRLALAVSLIALLVGVSACGSSAGVLGAEKIAQVDSTPITRATLSHWTATFIRGDYYSVMRKKAPAGLSSDPPDYAACVSAAKAIGAPRKVKFSDAQLTTKCHQLYETVKQEALRYLISVLWSAGQAAERGFKITDADIAERISQLQHEDFPKPGQFATYLTNKGWSRADLNYIVKRNLLSGEVLKSLEAKAGKGPASQHALGRLIESNLQKWTTKTHCRKGYVVEPCSEYKGKAPHSPSAAVIFEQLAGQPF